MCSRWQTRRRSVESCGRPSIKFGRCTRPTSSGWTRWRAIWQMSMNHPRVTPCLPLPLIHSCVLPQQPQSLVCSRGMLGICNLSNTGYTKHHRHKPSSIRSTVISGHRAEAPRGHCAIMLSSVTAMVLAYQPAMSGPRLAMSQQDDFMPQVLEHNHLPPLPRTALTCSPRNSSRRGRPQGT